MNEPSASDALLNETRRKYEEERARRVGSERNRYLDSGRTAKYLSDPFTEYRDREPLNASPTALIVGAGMAGILTAVELLKRGIDDFWIVDEAGGFGGTWYWNRYPGVRCDIEAHSYLPMLEEMDYSPSERYATGKEIRNYYDLIARKYQLYDHLLVHTQVEAATWDGEASTWRIETDRDDVLCSQYLVLAVGILNRPRIPEVPGLGRFGGDSFHTSRWDFRVTGGKELGASPRLADKAVAVLGTGATGIQCIPHLADASDMLYVFQRTPSAIGPRDNHETSEKFPADRDVGWQRRRQENFAAIMRGREVERDEVQDGWTRYFAAARNTPRPPGMSDEDYRRHVELADFAIMEEHRSRIDREVDDAQVAEILKPYYRYICKRPAFHDEYLSVYNRDNVRLIDAPAGVERVTSRGVVANGVEYHVDLIVMATGFTAERTPLEVRGQFSIFGESGISLGNKWGEGVKSFLGLMTHGFPNMFFTPAPGQQAVATINHALITSVAAEFIGGSIAQLIEENIITAAPTSRAEEQWCREVREKFVDRSDVLSACTPSRANFEGDISQVEALNSNYGGGLGDYFGYKIILERLTGRLLLEQLECSWAHSTDLEMPSERANLVQANMRKGDINLCDLFIP